MGILPMVTVFRDVRSVRGSKKPERSDLLGSVGKNRDVDNREAAMARRQTRRRARQGV
jgi:hypothetical protein